MAFRAVRKGRGLGVNHHPPPRRVQKVKIQTISGGKILSHLHLHLPLTKDLIINILSSKKITYRYFF